MLCVVMLNVVAPMQQLELLGVHSKLTRLVKIRKLSGKLMELAYQRPVAIVIFNTKNLNRCAMLQRSFSRLAHSILFTIKLLLNTNDPFLSKEVLLCDFLFFLKATLMTNRL
jgi:hypothetical protein